MDPNALANLALLVAAIVFMAVLCLRVGKAALSGRREGGAEPSPIRVEKPSAQEVEVEGAKPAQVPVPPRPMILTSQDVDRLLDRIVEEKWESVDSLAKEYLGYSQAQGGLRHIKPQVLEAIATEFAILEVAFKELSGSKAGEPSVVSDETRSMILREAFRLIASEARY